MENQDVPEPGFETHLRQEEWVRNVEQSLNTRLERESLDAAALDRARLASRRMAESYVRYVRAQLIKNFDLEANGPDDFGAGGAKPGWISNAFSDERKCWHWAFDIQRELIGALNTPDTQNSGWRLRIHKNISQAGDASLGILFPHNFVSLTFEPDYHVTLDEDDSADFVLDPWTNGRPDIFHASEFNDYWPLDAENAFHSWGWGG